MHEVYPYSSSAHSQCGTCAGRCETIDKFGRNYKLFAGMRIGAYLRNKTLPLLSLRLLSLSEKSYKNLIQNNRSLTHG
jgi:hypothetical protein